MLPLLLCIFLTLSSHLRFGSSLNQFIYFPLSPITTPISFFRSVLHSQIEVVKSMPGTYQKYQDLKSKWSGLLSENQKLKEAIKDQKVLSQIQNSTVSATPIRLVNNVAGKITATAGDLNSLQIGQPVTNGSILLGVITDIKSPIITITPLTDISSPVIPLKTGSGLKGKYVFADKTPQITGISSETKITLGDIVFTDANTNMPPTLVVGKVVKILSSPEEPFQKAEIKLESSFSDSQSSLTIITNQ